jgi:hypothetical protein
VFVRTMRPTDAKLQFKNTKKHSHARSDGDPARMLERARTRPTQSSHRPPLPISLRTGGGLRLRVFARQVAGRRFCPSSNNLRSSDMRRSLGALDLKWINE